MFNGIDVSRHQGAIDWDSVKPNIDFAIIRAGFGKNNIDAKARRNVSECERLGIPYGLYWFSYALHPEMAKKEAEYMIDFIGEHKPEYPIVYDFEYDTVAHANRNGARVDRQFVLNCTEEFCRTLEEHDFMQCFIPTTSIIDCTIRQARLLKSMICGTRDMQIHQDGL